MEKELDFYRSEDKPIDIKGYDNLVFFDTETTGFDPKENRIIELAAVKISPCNSSRIDYFVKLPLMQFIPDKIVELTGITDKMLDDEGVSEEEALKEFAGLLTGAGKTLLIAHNAQFDLNFIGWAFWRYREEHPSWNRAFNEADYLDSLTVYKDRRAFPHKLANAIEAYKLGDKVQNTHRAIDDCLALFEVTKAMQAERGDLESYINIFGVNPKYGVSGSTLKKVIYHNQGFNNSMTTPEQTLPAIIAKERR